jgi:hypothetical protein
MKLCYHHRCPVVLLSPMMKRARPDGSYVKNEGVVQRHGKGRLVDGPECYEGDWEADRITGKGA